MTPVSVSVRIEAADALAELEDGLRQVEALEPALAGLLAGAAPGGEQRVLPREGQLGDDEAGERIAGEVLAGPQRVDAEQDRLGVRAELLGQGRGAAVQALGQHQHAVVLHVLADRGGHAMHLALVGEQRQGAAAGDLGKPLEALGLALAAGRPAATRPPDRAPAPARPDARSRRARERPAR